MSQPSDAPKGMMQRFLDVVEKVGNKIPHPIIIFLTLIVSAILLSHLLYLLDVSAPRPRASDQIEAVQEGAPDIYYKDYTQYKDYIKSKEKKGKEPKKDQKKDQEETIDVKSLLPTSVRRPQVPLQRHARPPRTSQPPAFPPASAHHFAPGLECGGANGFLRGAAQAQVSRPVHDLLRGRLASGRGLPLAGPGHRLEAHGDSCPRRQRRQGPSDGAVASPA